MTKQVALACAFAAALTSTVALADTPAATPKPTIVLVHGAWADGSSWDRVVPLLLDKGYNVIAVQNPLSSVADDVAATKRAIEQATGDVILVGHSYGGVVISEAGNDPKVKALVYVAAFAPDNGESVNSMGKGKPQPEFVKTLKVDSGGFGWLPMDTVIKDFAQDLPEAEAKLLAVKQGPTAVKVLDEQMQNAAWHSKPTWYIRASQDRMISPGAEAAMAKRMKAKTTTLDASHVVMLSKPQQVAGVIIEAATTPPRTARR
jgi:pimeloyl-ACP methyl ester carboxylesterase